MYRSGRRRYEIEWLEARCLLTAVPLLPIGRGPDLFGGLFLTTLANKTVPYNAQVPVDFEIQNGTSLSAGTFNVAFYLSDDSTISTSDTLVGNRKEAGMAGNSTRSDSVTLQLPATDPFLTDNNYYLGMIVDSADAVSETNENNNSNQGTGSDRDFVKSELHLPTPANGSAVNATPFTIDTTIAASFADEWVGGSDIDTYSITVTAGERLAIDVDSPFSSTNALDSALRIYNSSFTLLASNNDAKAPNDTPNNSQNDPYLDYTFASAGTYYVVQSNHPNAGADPRSLSGRSAGQELPYDLTIAHVRPNLVTTTEFGGGAPGNAHPNALVLVSNDGYAASPATTVTFYLSDDETITTSDIAVTSLAVPSLAAGAEYSSGTVVLNLPTPDPFRTDNQYYVGTIADPAGAIVEVSESDNVSSGFTYTRSELGLPGPADGVNVQYVDFLDQPGGWNGSIGDEWIGPYDVDFAKFDGKAGEHFGIDVNRDPGSTLNSYLRLYNSNWTLLASNDNGAAPGETASLDSYIDYTLTADGTYYVAISSVGNTTGDPRLLTSRTAGSTAGGYNVLFTTPDPAPISILSSARDPVPGGGALPITFSLINYGPLDTPAFHVAFNLYRAFNAETDFPLASVLINSLAGGATLTQSIVLPLPATDPYRDDNDYIVSIEVDPNNEVTETVFGETNNSLHNQVFPFVTYLPITSEAHVNAGGGSIRTTPLTINTPLDAAIGDEWIGPYDIDTYAFSAVANQRIAFDLDRSSGTLDSYLRLYNSSLSLLASNDNGAAAGETFGTDSYIEYTFPTAGTYYLTISGKENSAISPAVLSGRVAGATGGYTITALQTSPPRVVNATLDYLTALDVALQMNENLASVFTGGDVTVLNRNTTDTYAANVAFDASTNLATLTFPGEADNLLPDANYRVTVNAAGVVDSIGNALDGNSDGVSGDNYTFDFFFLNADANRDRVVNALDFNALASNYGGTGRNFAQGNFNYDGVVNSIDFDMLASRFGKSLAPLAGAPVASTPMAKLFSRQAVGDDSSLADLLNETA